MRKLLLLSYTFPPDNTAAAVRPGQLYEYLPALGYQPHVIASSFEGDSNDRPRVHRVPKAEEPGRLQFASGMARWFMRYCAPYDDRLPWVPYALSAAAGLVHSAPVDAIFSTSPFLASHFTALWLKAKYGLPWIADFQDPIRDNPFRTRRWLYPYDALIEYFIFRYADRLIANTDTVAAAWRTRYPRWSEKVSVLWNSFDPREEVPLSQPPKRPYRVLAHVGSLYGERHPCHLLSALERLGAGPSNIRVKLVGPIEPALLDRHKPLFDRLVRTGLLEYGNRLVERTEALRETAEADYLLLLDLNEQNASLQLPSKLLDYIRYGKPILAYTSSDSPVERVLARSGISYVAIDPTEIEAAAEKKIAEFMRLPTEPRRATSWFREAFSAETQAHTVSGLLDSLLAQANSQRPIAR